MVDCFLSNLSFSFEMCDFECYVCFTSFLFLLWNQRREFFERSLWLWVLISFYSAHYSLVLTLHDLKIRTWYLSFWLSWSWLWYFHPIIIPDSSFHNGFLLEDKSDLDSCLFQDWSTSEIQTVTTFRWGIQAITFHNSSAINLAWCLVTLPQSMNSLFRRYASA